MITRTIIDLKNSVWQKDGQAKAETVLIPSYQSIIHAEIKSELAIYGAKILDVVCLTGSAPVWLYLIAYDSVKPYARKVVFNSPLTGEVTIFER